MFKCSVLCYPIIAFCYREEVGPLECETNGNLSAECGLFCPGTGRLHGSSGIPVPGRLKGTGRWCSSASACSAQVAPSATFLWLLGAQGSNQNYGWGLAAVVGKEGMGQREIRKRLQNCASEVYSNNLCLRKPI